MIGSIIIGSTVLLSTALVGAIAVETKKNLKVMREYDHREKGVENEVTENLAETRARLEEVATEFRYLTEDYRGIFAQPLIGSTRFSTSIETLEKYAQMEYNPDVYIEPDDVPFIRKANLFFQEFEDAKNRGIDGLSSEDLALVIRGRSLAHSVYDQTVAMDKRLKAREELEDVAQKLSIAKRVDIPGLPRV